LTFPQITSALIILAGVAVALAPGAQSANSARENSEISRTKAGQVIVAGAVFGVIAALCQALGAVLSGQGFALEEAIGESIDGITEACTRIMGGMLVRGLFVELITVT